MATVMLMDRLYSHSFGAKPNTNCDKIFRFISNVIKHFYNPIKYYLSAINTKCLCANSHIFHRFIAPSILRKCYDDIASDVNKNAPS